MKMYMVGGAVRDELLGVRSKDIDYSVVLNGNEDGWHTMGGNDPFHVMEYELERKGFKIFLRTPEYFTIRAQFPRDSENHGLTADFVLARKDGEYSDGRRPDDVMLGSLEDDLARRDFTMNAIAKDSEGCLIDPYNGVSDIEHGIIRCVGEPTKRFSEDALRAVRALRFSVTKGFSIYPTVEIAMQSPRVLNAIETKISDERIMDELNKMFKYNTQASLLALFKYPMLMHAIFAGSISIDATMKQKGRNK